MLRHQGANLAYGGLYPFSHTFLDESYRRDVLAFGIRFPADRQVYPFDLPEHILDLLVGVRAVPYSELSGDRSWYILLRICQSCSAPFEEVHLNGDNVGGGDQLYLDEIEMFPHGGDVALWTKAAYAIDARAYLHQAPLSTANYTAALSSINQAFDSSADDMSFQFGDAATTAAPWYQFNRDRGDTGFNSTFGDALDAVSDPRRDIYDGDADIDNFGDVVDTHEYFVIDQAVELITYRELLFARAEALLATGGSQADIRAAYLEAIESSFTSLGLEAEYSAYIAQPAVAPATITLENVMTQKWFASYADPESFTDWRRTGIPALTPNNGVAVPRRWLYPQTEIELNSNTPDVTLTDRVDWDVN